MTFRKTLLAATMLALPAVAQAQPVRGLYVGAGAGVNWMDNTTASVPDNDVTVPFGARISTGPGFVGVLSLGWGFGNGLRLEAEGNYRSNDVDSISISAPVAGLGFFGRSGYITSMGLMANVMYDIGSTMGWPVHITVGGGVGYAWVRYNGVGISTTAGENIRASGTDGQFAYQGIAGITYPIRSVPGLALTLEYRYFATTDIDMNARYNAAGVSAALPATSVSYANNSAMIGVRYNFGQARPAAPVAAAPAPARSFLVFFDFASDQLTARAREIVGQAAQAARSQQVTRIEVAGHTDTVGSAQYNQGLSIRRANNVAAELVRQGVPRQAITTAGFGFSRLLVPTGPNVREPQNRRVEIVLR